MSLVPWNAVRTVNTTTSASQFGSSIAKLIDGSMVIAFVDNSSGNSDVRFQRFDALGNKLGIETLAHTASTNTQYASDVAGLSDGGFVISYVDLEGNVVFGQKFTAGGVPNGGPIILSNPTFSASPSGFAKPVLQALSGGEFAVFYETNNFSSASSSRDIVGRIVNASGTPGAAFGVATSFTGQQFGTDVVVDIFGQMVVVWEDESAGAADIKARTFDAQGVEINPEFTVNTITANAQRLASITPLSNGNLVVTWYSPNFTNNYVEDIYGQVINAFGGKFGTEFIAGTTQSGIQAVSKVVALADSKFMVVYTTLGLTDTIRAQVFNGNGTTAGPELLLATTGVNTFSLNDAVVLDDGRVAITWTDASVDGDGRGVAMQILDPREGVWTGTAGADKAWGHDGNVDFMRGGAGADIIYGLAGADTIYDDAGIDNLYGGRGDDTVYGGADNDIIYGDLGDDEQYGEAGNDIIYSAGGADRMDGGAGTGDAAFYVNELLGATINLTDQLLTSGSALGDTLFNFERVYGSVRGSNNLTGDAQANILVGGLVADTLNGGGGVDVLRGWGGVDTMSGGANNDIFQYTGNTEGGDIITDFAAGDKFQFVRTAFGNLAGANVAAANFLSVASGHAAANASQKFIFDQATKQLWYDADGNGAGAGVMIADLSTSYNILNTDLLLA